MGIDEKSGDIAAAVLSIHNVGDSEMLKNLLDQIEGPIDQVSADEAYDSYANYALLEKRGIKAIFPTRETAKIKQHSNCKEPALQRDVHLRAILKLGKAAWKKVSGYHQRSLVETAMFKRVANLEFNLAIHC